MKTNISHTRLLLLLLQLLLCGCDVHEWPFPSDTVPLHLRLDCQTEMTRWEHTYTRGVVTEIGVGEESLCECKNGELRYIVQAFASEKRRTVNREVVAEFIFTKDLAEGYIFEDTISLPPGDYDIAVWADMRSSTEVPVYYNANNFASISLDGEYKGSDDYRDAFQGRASIALETTVIDKAPDTLSIKLSRPMAKFEFVTSDIVEFIEKKIDRTGATRTIDIDDYEVRFYYVGYLPTSYNHFVDSPSNAELNRFFVSSLLQFDDGNASLGFDYIFTYNDATNIAVQVGIYSCEGKQLSLTEPIDVPLRRSYHTMIRGEFLLSEAAGGVVVDPGYEGDHNVVIP